MGHDYFEDLLARERRHEERRALFAALRERRPRRRGGLGLLFWLIGG